MKGLGNWTRTSKANFSKRIQNVKNIISGIKGTLECVSRPEKKVPSGQNNQNIYPYIQRTLKTVEKKEQ